MGGIAYCRWGGLAPLGGVWQIGSFLTSLSLVVHTVSGLPCMSHTWVLPGSEVTADGRPKFGF